MPIDLDSLVPFAESCARSHVRKHNAPDRYADATGEASLYLWRRRDLWSLPEPELRRRVELQLIRAYQNAHGMRRRAPRVVRDPDVDCYQLASRRDDVAAFDDRDEARTLIERAAAQAGVLDCVPILLAIAEGRSRADVAAEFGIPETNVDRIFAAFKIAAKRLDGVRGVELVDEDDQTDDAPLFAFMKTKKEKP